MSISIPERFSSILSGFTGRAWLLPVLADWLENRSERIFLLTGEPGCGKSMISTWLASGAPAPAGTIDSALWEHLALPVQVGVDFSDLWSRLRAPLGAAHFCQSTSGNISPRATAQALSRQLGESIPQFDQALQDSLKDLLQLVVQQEAQVLQTGAQMVGPVLELAGLAEESSFDRALRNPLEMLYKGGYTKELLIIVDGLDEALVYTGAINLVTLLTRLDDLPAPVRFLVTSRPVDGVLNLFTQARRFDLIKDAPPEAAADLPAYLRGRLINLPQNQRDLLVEMISNAAENNFLYAYLEANEMVTRQEWPEDLRKLKMPAKLSGVYQEFLNREVGTNRDRWYQRLKPVMGLVAVAQENGFTNLQIKAIAGHDVDPDLEICRPYMDGSWRAGPFKPFHKSFADYLLDESSNTDYHVDAAEMHAMVTAWLCPITCSARLGQWDEYAVRNAITHLAGAAPMPRPAGSPPFVQMLVDTVLDPNYAALYKSKVNDLNGMQANLEQALRAATEQNSLEALPLVVRLALELVKFRKEELQPDAPFSLAKRGQVDQAERRLVLFETDAEWLIISRLTLAWLAVLTNRAGGLALRQRISGPKLDIYPINLLAKRVDAALNNQLESGLPALPKPPEEAQARDFVLRLSGQHIDTEMMMSYLSSSGMGEMLQVSGEFFSRVDGPPLVAYTLRNHELGDELFQYYINLHTGYDYPEYRRKSLWYLLDAVLRHPDPNWVLRFLPQMCAAALAGSRLDYQQGIALTVVALRAAAGDTRAAEKLQGWMDASRQELQSLEGDRRKGDTYGYRQRRLAALAQTLSLLLERDPESENLLSLAADTAENKRGMAGFQFAASLALADTILACHPWDFPAAEQTVQRALVSAQNINDSCFCARSVARVNALQRRWPMGAMLDLTAVIDRLRIDPGSPEFATLYLPKQQFERNPGSRALDEAFLHPTTLADLPLAFNQTPSDFERLNRPLGLALSSSLAGIPEVNVPDRGFATFLAAHLSAALLADESLSQDKKAELLMKLVPVASPNPTALDAVLSRLLIAVRPVLADVLQKLDDLTHPYLAATQEEKMQFSSLINDP